ncbi:MAG TPA: hypothetical protein VFW50_00310 [Streptosporangiaceae bacterium]|nr:hypothetical protein [Streptosporangiaceae bacterium]
MEGYGLEELAASAEAVLAGLGPLAAGLARLAADAGGAVTLDAMETLLTERGRELLRGWSSSGWMPRRMRRCGGRGWPARTGCGGAGRRPVMPVRWSRRWAR